MRPLSMGDIPNGGDTMRRIAMFAALAAVILAGIPAFAGADEITVEGQILCAKCSLKKADAEECQNVLVVDKKDSATEYYLVKNDVVETFGHVCQGKKPAIVTGTVEDKDGKTWLTATKIDAPGEGKKG